MLTCPGEGEALASGAIVAAKAAGGTILNHDGHLALALAPLAFDGQGGFVVRVSCVHVNSRSAA